MWTTTGLIQENTLGPELMTTVELAKWLLALDKGTPLVVSVDGFPYYKAIQATNEQVMGGTLNKLLCHAIDDTARRISPKSWDDNLKEIGFNHLGEVTYKVSDTDEIESTIPDRVPFTDLVSLITCILAVPEKNDLFLMLGEEVRRLPFATRLIILAAFGAPLLGNDTVYLRDDEEVIALMTHSLVCLCIFGDMEITEADKESLINWFGGYKAITFTNLLDQFFRAYGFKVIRV